MAPCKPEDEAASGKRHRKDLQGLLNNIRTTIKNAKARLDSFSKTRIEKTDRRAIKLKQTLLQQSIEKSSATHNFRLAHEFEASGKSKSNHLTVDDFEVGPKLGRGKFGTVFLGRHTASGYICALKIISKAQVTTSEEEKLIRRELEIHQQVSHPSILRFLGWFHDEKRIFIVLEYACGGNLFERLRAQASGRFSEPETARYVAQMASALRYLHGKSIMHRDLKPENILLGLHDEMKLADFGYSVHSASGFRSTVCGTLDYLSPEVAMMMHKPGKAKEFYTKAVDQWSLGVLTYELLVGKPPFETKGMKATEKKIANFKGKVMVPKHVSEQARNLIQRLLDLDAERRMTVEDVLAHPWIVRHCE